MLAVFGSGIAIGAVAGVFLDRQRQPSTSTSALVAVPNPVTEKADPVETSGERESHRSLANEALDREAIEALYTQLSQAADGADRPSAATLDVLEDPLWESPPLETTAGEQTARLPEDPQGHSVPTPQYQGMAPWRRHAVAVAAGDRPMIAVVLDDLGLNRPAARQAISLPAPLTLAFMTYAEGLAEMSSEARAAGHELMVHLPMEPRDRRHNPGPNALTTDAPPDELVRRLNWGLERFDGYVGINNHMGSHFTAWGSGMATVMAQLKARGLLFLDSKTSGSGVPGRLATEIGVPFAERDVFLDNDPNDPMAVRRQLVEAERIAQRRGFAVAIGHPHKVTLEALADWLPGLAERGFILVPISTIAEQRLAKNKADGTTPEG